MSSSTLSSAPTESPEHPSKKIRLSPPDNTAPFSQPQASATSSSTRRRGSPPRRGFFSSTPRSRVVTQQNATPTIIPAAVPLFSPPENSLLSRVVSTAAVNTAPNTSAWEAARESVLSQMVTAQDIEVSATVPKAKAKPKTGGRRGRGGRTATTRTPKVKTEPVDTPTGLDAGITPVTPASRKGTSAGRGRGGARVNRGGRPRARGGSTRAGGGKRKRNQSDDEVDIKEDSDASEIYAPLTQSRSGRKLIQTTTFTPSAVIDLEASIDMKPPPPRTTSSAKKAAPREKAEKQPHKKPTEAAVCKNCGRGQSPLSNMIVFCDGCNSPWHQYCHNPPIGQDVIRVLDSQWYCGDCSVLQTEKKTWNSNISAERMTISEKRRYLLTLPPENLISILLHATTLHPGLPIFSAVKPPTAEAIQVVAQTPNQTVEQAAAEEELYDYFTERELIPYPKAGHGVAAKLPPESDDLGMLIDEDIMTYSHSWGWTEADLFETGMRDLDRWVEGTRAGVGVGA